MELEGNELLQVSPKPLEKSGGDLDKRGAEGKGNHICNTPTAVRGPQRSSEVSHLQTNV